MRMILASLVVAAIGVVGFAMFDGAFAQSIPRQVACPSVEVVNVRLSNVNVRLSEDSRSAVPSYFDIRRREAIDVSAQRFVRAVIAQGPNSTANLNCIYSREDNGLSENLLRLDSGVGQCWPSPASAQRFSVLPNRSLSCSDSPEQCAVECLATSRMRAN